MDELRDEITPVHIYRSRRAFLKAAGFVGAGSLLAAACRGEEPAAEVIPSPTVMPPGTTPGVATDELTDVLTPYEEVTGINNFYEFTTNKTGVKELAEGFPTSPWTVEVGGLVRNPGTLSIGDFEQFGSEDHIYRMRCVEGWSMVIPWNGFQLERFLDFVEPTDEARYIRFETVADVDNMPGLTRYPYPWPYVEGLRLDEARHPLTILATGVYGEQLPPQSGGPIRLVVPWKYGFKSIKSIIKIELVAEQPLNFWSAIAPDEYGFYANVNPDVDHPRWSQATELRLGESERRPTLLFNGYADQVASLYEGMDLRENY
ncbi:MAG: protein-methionine-sulfoxide reductase catalytic subunit MsrP [Anaerolineales bacterium]|jgi:sulfoxide reductase catalytic subunit YedY